MLYTVVIEPAVEGGYLASVPALSGCVSQGETLREVRANIREAIEGWLASSRTHSEVAPKDRRPGRVKRSARVIRVHAAA